MAAAASSGKVQRFGMTLLIRPEKLEDYVREHDNIWPEVHQALKSVGIQNLTIWKMPDQDRLFMSMEYTRADEEPFDSAMARYAKMPRVQEWEDLMRTMQVQIPGCPPDTWWQRCRELFHMA